MNSFQESLNELMIENNLNRLRLAKIVGVSSTAINGYYNSNSYPSIVTAVKLAGVFGCSLDYLFGLSDKKEPKYNAPNINTNNFYENLEKLILQNNLSIAKTMKLLNIKEDSFYNWRKGSTPSMSNILAVANYFDVSLDHLIFGNI